MKTKPTRPLRHLLDRAQKRFVRSRPGSVLILVVALLVMMALIGTAYMTMAQFDRGTAVVHSFNTEVDLLLDGVLNQVKGTITNDVYSSGQFRPAVIMQSSTNLPVTYNTPGNNAAPHYWTGLGVDNGTAGLMNNATPPPTVPIQPGNWWLASRVPGLPSETSPVSSGNPPWWPFLTGPINGGTTFDQPYWPPTTNGDPRPAPLTQRIQLAPTFTQDTSKKLLFIDGQVWPAFTTAAGGISNAGGIPWMAADADGDGIADSGLVKLLTLDGVTYYAAVRIVDNSAAINANIAWQPNPASTYAAGTSLPGDFSPVNIDLAGIIVPPSGGEDDLTGKISASPPGAGLLKNYRWNGQAAPSQTPISEPVAVPPNPTPPPPYARNDFQFPTEPDRNGNNCFFNAQWFELGRRLRNPGYITPVVKYQALPISEDLTLARGFVLRNPNVLDPALSPSVLEQRMPNTLFVPAPTSPYIANAADPLTFPYPLKWFTDSFDYFAELSRGKNYLSKRPLIVAENPVSNFAPVKFNPNPMPTQYQFGDILNMSGEQFVCICPTTTMPLANTARDPYWAWEPWTNSPTKTSVNTATFQQLYAAYWAVMADQYTPPTFDKTGRMVSPGQWAPPFPIGGGPARMFRNPCRAFYPTPGSVSTAGGMTPTQVMYLRSALAAINTMQLRGGNAANLSQHGTDDVLSRTVWIPDAGGAIHYEVNVYGAEKQPYITHIFAQNDPKGDTDPTLDFMAIELYNPFPTAIDISGWKLAVVDRTTVGNLTLQSIDGATEKPLSQLITSPKALTSIAAHSFIVICSSLSPASIYQWPTGEPGPNFYECQDLKNAFGKELVLMRPRLAKGTAIQGDPTNQNNQFNETVTPTPTDTKTSGFVGLYDWIPVDSYDFTKMPTVPAKKAVVQIWDYRRADDPSGGKDWHFVYPGPWQVKGTGAPDPNGTPPTWSGTTVQPAPQGGQTTLPMLGATNAMLPPPPGITYQDVALQVNNTDFGGPGKVNGGSGNTLPLGAFARDGDILQTTYIGAYKVVDVSQVVKGGAPQLVELNTISADSAMATADDAISNPKYRPMASGTYTAENIGRFCPIDNEDANLAGFGGIDDFAPPPTGGGVNANWMYHWTMRLFDFLSVHGPQDDYLPNVDPWGADFNYGTNYRYGPANSNPQNIPTPVANLVAGAANAGMNPQRSPNPIFQLPPRSEDTTPIDGLVNVNTAPWRVLAAIPWIPASYTDFRAQNAQIGLALAYYRDVDDGTATGAQPKHGHGPFRNLYELAEARIALTPPAPHDKPRPPYTTPGVKLRDIMLMEQQHSPLPDFADQMTFLVPDQQLVQVSTGLPGTVKGDFLAEFNMLTRLSNLVTTRSDSFTAYVLIQGWRNAETQNPHLVVQRRAAVNIDRSNVTPNNRSPNAVNVPMN
jgi:hypothetical protein